MKLCKYSAERRYKERIVHGYIIKSAETDLSALFLAKLKRGVLLDFHASSKLQNGLHWGGGYMD